MTFGPAVDVSPAGQDANIPLVVLDPQNRATVVWRNPTVGVDGIQARRIAADGTQIGLADLSPSGVGDGEPAVAVDPNGNTIAAWTRTVGGFDVTESRRIAPDGAEASLQQLSDTLGGADEPDLDFTPSGSALAVWSRTNGATYDIAQARGLAADGTPMATTTDLSASGAHAEGQKVVVDPSGHATVVWLRDMGLLGSADDLIQARRLAGDGTALAPTKNIAPHGGAEGRPDVAIDSQGNATIVWVLGAVPPTTVQVRRLAADGATLTASQDLSTTGIFVATPQVVVDGQGVATATWPALVGSHTVVQERRIDAAGNLSATQNVSDVGLDATSPGRLAVDAQGNVTMAWSVSDGTNGVIQARTLAVDGTLSATQNVFESSSPSTTAPRIAVDPRGDAIIAFQHFDGTHSNVAVARYVAPPAPNPPPNVAPRVSDLSFSPAAFRIGSLLPRLSRATPTGTTIRFTLSEAASARLVFARAAAGRRVGRRCLPATRARRRRRRCTRYVDVRPALVLTAHAGRNKVRFQGRLSRRVTLRAGRYRMTNVATDSEGARSTARSASFTLLAKLRRRR